MPPASPSLSPHSAATKIVRALRDAGHVAYFAGGCVRDVLLNRAPSDWDVATDATPDRVRELFAKTQAVGAAFGVVLVRLDQHVIEVATFRSDGTYADGRRPESVTFTDAEHDAQRRDFTINGLFYDPIEHRVIDFVGGQADLQARIVRAIGDPAARFNEDHLRVLRAVRFAARLDFEIEPTTAHALEQAAPKLSRISGERVADELRRMLTPVSRWPAYRMLWRHGLLQAIQPETALTINPLDEHRSIFMNLAPAAQVSFGVAWLAAAIDHRWQNGDRRHDLLGNLNAIDAGRLATSAKRSLKFSNEECDEMTNVAHNVHGLLTAHEPSAALFKRFLAHPSAIASRQFLGALGAAGFAADRVRLLNEQLDTLAGTDVAPPPLVSGDDLIRLGFAPGRQFKDVLTQVYDAQLNGMLVDRDAAFRMALDLFGRS